MEYRNYEFNDFIEDFNFRNWVLNPDQNTHVFWEDFLDKFPEKEMDVDYARRFLLSVKNREESNFTTQADQNIIFQQIAKQIEKETYRFKPIILSWARWAASAILIVLIAVWYALQNDPEQTLTYEQIKLESELVMIENINNAKEPIFISLLDGSFIELQPNSKVSYSESFGLKNKREVYLSGEAFFKVLPNPNKPFYVYSNELVTKVLGTSFNIKAYAKDKNITVRVSTGRVHVEVSKKLSIKQKPNSSVTGILLDSNQQVVISRKKLILSESVTYIPKNIPLNSIITDKQLAFKFESSSAIHVFNVLEQSYHVNIILDKVAFANCQLTADLTNESLIEKLNIICTSIEADYDILDDQIIITGKGCNF